MKRLIAFFAWLGVALLGAWAYVTLALHRGERLNSAFILIAAVCTYAIGYRFYSKWIAARVLALDDRRATPCEVHDDGKDFVKTNKWIVFGHHFAAISGPGPLVGPVLAAQFGYLPGTLWILIGVVLGGAVQDFIILFASMRRDGKSLAQMIREELNSAAGVIGVIAILSIMIILLAVLALVVVNALAESPWGVFTVGATIPIALFMGGYLRWLRAGKVMEATVIGIALLLLAVWGGQFVGEHTTLKGVFKLNAPTLAWAIILYAFAASVLPVWLLLAPRDYLSTFMKLGTIFALAAGVLLVLPSLQMPAFTRFVDGSGPVVPGKLFPFCFITIACGAISGFHTLIASGVTPKIMTRESFARPIGYGAMLLESLVAIMAMIAACTLEPGVYLAMNIKVPGADAATVASATVERVNSFGPTFTLTTNRMTELASAVKEETLYGRTGGAATLAVGMANIFHNAMPGMGERWLGVWYHFALMFEALFILTTLDAGTRVGRYLLQDALGHVAKPLGDVRSLGANLFASGLVVALWGYFLIKAVYDPDGGIKALWPIFGIANQLLAATALCLATTILLKMMLNGSGDLRVSQRSGDGSRLHPPHPDPLPKEREQVADVAGKNHASKLAPAQNPILPLPKGEGWGEGKGTTGFRQAGFRSPVLALVTLIPLLCLLTVTGTAAVQKIWHSDARIGFVAQAHTLSSKLEGLKGQTPSASDAGFLAHKKQIAQTSKQLGNAWLDAAVTGFFLLLVAAIFLISLREWILLLARRKLAQLRETEPVWLPDYTLAERSKLGWLGVFALAFGLAKELSGEAAVDRAQQHAAICAQPVKVDLLAGGAKRVPLPRGDAYVRSAQDRFEGIRRCC